MRRWRTGNSSHGRHRMVRRGSTRGSLLRRPCACAWLPVAATLVTAALPARFPAPVVLRQAVAMWQLPAAWARWIVSLRPRTGMPATVCPGCSADTARTPRRLPERRRNSPRSRCGRTAGSRRAAPVSAVAPPRFPGMRQAPATAWQSPKRFSSGRSLCVSGGSRRRHRIGRHPNHHRIGRRRNHCRIYRRNRHRRRAPGDPARAGPTSRCRATGGCLHRTLAGSPGSSHRYSTWTSHPAVLVNVAVSAGIDVPVLRLHGAALVAALMSIAGALGAAEELRNRPPNRALALAVFTALLGDR